jgi:hypothetical protein
MKKIKIFLDGCDDTTEFEMKVTEEQLEFLNALSQKSKETSTYGCMPTMSIRE